MRVTCEIIAYRLFYSTALATNEIKTKNGVAHLLVQSEIRWSLAVLNVKTILKRLNAETNVRSPVNLAAAGSRQYVQTVSLNRAKNQRKNTDSVYASMDA